MPASKSAAPPGPAPAIGDILALLGQVSDKFEPDNTALRGWLAQHSPNPAVRARLADTTVLAFRVLDAVGRLEPVNGATIAKDTRTPKGSVSKIARRLIADGLARSETLPHNKKAVFFRLTPLGRELFTVHRAFDQQMERGFIRFLERYHPDELLFIVRLLTDLLTADFLSAAAAPRAKR